MTRANDAVRHAQQEVLRARPITEERKQVIKNGEMIMRETEGKAEEESRAVVLLHVN